MILRIAYQDSDPNGLDHYWNELRNRNYDASFDNVKQYFKGKQDSHHNRRRRRSPWRWMAAALLPLLVLLACTKTETTEPVGATISFSIPEVQQAAFQNAGGKHLIAGLQVINGADQQRPGYLSYIVFVPATKGPATDALVSHLETIPGIAALKVVPVNMKIKESLLSKLSSKVFSTHIDATTMSHEELQQTIESQLRSNGIHQVDVIVKANKNGQRMVQLIPNGKSGDYSIDLSINDGLNKTELKEEIRTMKEPAIDLSTLTDAQLRDHMRKEHGAHLRDEDIRVTRTADHISIAIKQGEGTENNLLIKTKK